MVATYNKATVLLGNPNGTFAASASYDTGTDAHSIRIWPSAARVATGRRLADDVSRRV